MKARTLRSEVSKWVITFLASLILLVGSVYLGTRGNLDYFDLVLSTVPILIYALGTHSSWSVAVCGFILLALYAGAWSSVMAGWQFGVPLAFAASLLALATTTAGALVDRSER